MKTIELLSPVGNQEMFYQAIHNGADAVYLAGMHYGARKFADNFSDEALKEIFLYARLYGVKVYVTINTLIYEQEVEDVLRYVEFLYCNGVDALIMQDIGMMDMVHRRFPNLEIHASTQCHNYSVETLAFWKDFGVTRVVLARELGLEDITKMDVAIEKEVFVYGALCVCYSGCCLFSSMNGGRSGNRGECVGSCRLPYQLLRNGEVIELKEQYLLSTKELNTLAHVKELITSGVGSLKIEGRMKSPYYVGYVTRMYRKLIDDIYQGHDAYLTEEEQKNLERLYHRGFTDGYLFQSQDIMNNKSPNHIGIPLGKVIRIRGNKIYIRLEQEALYQEDGIRFQESNQGMMVNRLYNESGLLTNCVDHGQIAVVDYKYPDKIKVNEPVLKTIDHHFIQKLEEYPLKKIKISMIGNFLIGKPFWIELSDGIHCVREVGEVVQRAMKREVCEAEIKKQLMKLGNTPFVCQNITIQKDEQTFINLKAINEVRRNAVSRLIEKRQKIAREFVIQDLIEEDTLLSEQQECFVTVLVRTEEQLQCCVKNNVYAIYVADYELYHSYQHLNNIYYQINRVMEKNQTFKDAKLLVGDVGSIKKYGDENELVGDYFLNVTNTNSIKVFRNLKLKRVSLSVELEKDKIREMMKSMDEVEVIVYGRVELMVTKYCPLKKHLKYCGLCHKSKGCFSLKDKMGRVYPMIRKNCITHIMDSKNINRISDVQDYRKMGIRYYRIELFDEKLEEVERLLRQVRGELK